MRWLVRCADCSGIETRCPRVPLNDHGTVGGEVNHMRFDMRGKRDAATEDQGVSPVPPSSRYGCTRPIVATVRVARAERGLNVRFRVPGLERRPR